MSASTADVDVVTDEQAAPEEASLLACEHELPENLVTPNPGMWMPPLPDGVLDPPAAPGLQVTDADDGFLFATELIAQGTKDADDVALAHRGIRYLAEDAARMLQRGESHVAPPAANSDRRLATSASRSAAEQARGVSYRPCTQQPGRPMRGLVYHADNGSSLPSKVPGDAVNGGRLPLRTRTLVELPPGPDLRANQ